MSLTLFLRQQDVKARFEQEFPLPPLKTKPKLLIPSSTRNPQLIGTAFDYLLRFYVKFLNPQAQENGWIAEKSVALLLWKDRIRLSKQGSLIVTQAKKNYATFQQTGQFTDELLKSVLLLAKLDSFYRVSIIDENLELIDEQDILDLRNLIEVVDPESFKSSGIVVLNPSWGKASRLVSGADGDLIIDDLLIDIKAVKELARRECFNQLMGYYTLSVLNERFQPDAQEIKRLGIYYSRHKFLNLFNIEDVVNYQTFPAFLEWFISRALSGRASTIAS